MAEDGAVIFGPPPANGVYAGSPGPASSAHSEAGRRAQPGSSLLGACNSFFLAPEAAEQRLVTEKVTGAPDPSQTLPHPFPSLLPPPSVLPTPSVQSTRGVGEKHEQTS